MSLIAANNTELDLQDSKPEDKSLAMIWQHGLMFSMASDIESGLFAWKKTSQQHRLLRYDARGHHASKAAVNESDYLWTNLAKDTLAVAEHSEADKVVLAGASMGCATSLLAALELISSGQQDKLAGLILVIPPTAWQTRKKQAAKYKLLALLNKLKIVPRFLPALVRHKVLPKFLDKSLPYTEAVLTRYMATHDAEVYHPLLTAAANSDLPDAEQFKKIEVPCMILAWVEDESHPVHTAKVLREMIPNSEIHLANDARHVTEWDDLINEFLTRLKK